MKISYLFLLGSLLVLIPMACKDSNYSTSSYPPMGTPTYTTPTPTPIVAMAAITIRATYSSLNGYLYSPASVTIAHGQSVMWDITNMGYPLNIGDSSGNCLVSGMTSFPYSYTFSSTGTFYFHSGVYSSCPNGVCPAPSTCSGMVGALAAY